MERPDDFMYEARSLLERIQQVAPQLDARAPAPATAATSGYDQQWPAYHAAYLAAVDSVRRAPSRNPGSVNPWFFVVATGLNTIVAAVLAVLITLSVVRQDVQPDGGRAQWSSPTPVNPAAEPKTLTSVRGAVMTADLAPIAQAATIPVEVQPIGSPERPLRLEVLKASSLPLVIRPEEALAEPFILFSRAYPQRPPLLEPRELVQILGCYLQIQPKACRSQCRSGRLRSSS